MSTTHLLSIALDNSADPAIARELAEIVHQVIPGSHTLDSVLLEADHTDFEWDDNALQLPMGAAEAKHLVNKDGRVSVITTVDQHSFMTAYGAGLSDWDAASEVDVVHERVFSFGYPADAMAIVLAVQDDQFVVEYTTSIRDFIADAA
jgi:hypothetical protein